MTYCRIPYATNIVPMKHRPLNIAKQTIHLLKIDKISSQRILERDYIVKYSNLIKLVSEYCEKSCTRSCTDKFGLEMIRIIYL